MRIKSLILFIGLTLIVLGVVARPTHAADIRTGERVVVAADEVIDDDLIVSAQFVEVNGTVTGDLVATGTVIIINGNVGGSAIVAAQSVEERGAIDGSLYGTAYSLLLGEGAAVTRNVLFGGFSAATQAGSEVGRDFYVAGYQMLHDGRIGGDLNVSTVALQLNGAVGGDVAGEVNAAGSAALPQIPLPNMPATITTLPSGLVVGPAAQIGGQTLIQEISPTPQPQVGAFGLQHWLSDRLGTVIAVSYTHLRAHETVLDLVCRLLLEKKKKISPQITNILH